LYFRVLTPDNYLKLKKQKRMKKALLAFAIIGFVACNNEATEEKTPGADTATTAPAAVDTTAPAAVDTTKKDTMAPVVADTTKK
jgi:hypothetical protein